ncbi:MAG: hypothetical protein M3Y56_07145, partial [Armatimonadota bacterium]|nr:hypothetical protein [Armatimonadota bacterium]
PYVKKGQRLYLNAYQAEDHKLLAHYLHLQRTLRWIMSYDDSNLVRSLYRSHVLSVMSIRYSLQEKRSARELIIAPYHLSVPTACRVRGQESLLKSTRLIEGRLT